MESFDKVQKAVDFNYLFLEEILTLDYENLTQPEKDFLFSQLRKSVGITLRILEKHK